MRFKDLPQTLLSITAVLFLLIAPAGAKTINIVAFGDSLMAGYQLPVDEAYPIKLAQALQAKGYDITMSNASVSGDTTSGGLSRLDWSIPDGTDAVILGLGANDALRGLPASITQENIDKMVARLKERNIGVILMGMLAPPNMGSDYEAAFNPIYPKIAKKYQVKRYPFFLDGVAGIAALNIEDGIHPNPEGIALLVEKTLPSVEELLQSITE